MVKNITSHQRHSKLLYIIFLRLWNSVHTRSYSTRRTGLWKYICYNTSEATTNSDISVVIFIEITTMSWELNMIIWKQSVLWSLRSIRTQMWPWSNKRWQMGSTRRGDASYITPFHTFWQTRSHGVQVPHVHIPSLHSWCKPCQSGPMIRSTVEKLHSQSVILAVLILKQLCGSVE